MSEEAEVLKMADEGSDCTRRCPEMFKRLGALFGGRAPLDTIADPVLQTDCQV